MKYIHLLFHFDNTMFKHLNKENALAFTMCLAFIMLLLILDIGFGLILTLALYCISQYFLKTFNRKLPFTVSKILTSILLLGLLGLTYLGIHSAIKYCMYVVATDNGQTLQLVMNSVNDLKHTLPEVLVKKLPSTTSEIEVLVNKISTNFNQHLMGLGSISINYFFQILFSLIITISLLQKKNPNNSVMIAYLKKNIQDFIACFKILMGAQVYVALWNAAWLFVYLFFVLPMFDIDIAYKKTLILFTLFMSLIPALGNIVSNFALLIMCMPFGIVVIISSLIFMILIHKAEYLINAKIIGKHSNANVVEILMALIIFELLFGIDGLILGPVTYAYVKGFLLSQKVL